MKGFLIAAVLLAAAQARAGWPSFSDFDTNEFSTAGNKVALKQPNQFAVTSLVVRDNGTNYWVDFRQPELRLTCTNDVHLALSTNWPATNYARLTGITVKGDTVDRVLTWNADWKLLGNTNTSLTIGSNKVARASFLLEGAGETNVVWGWVSQ